MEGLQEENAYYGIIMCNGEYDPSLFSLKLITFAALLGYRVDENNALNFLNSSVWKNNRENIFVLVNTEKEELEAEFKRIHQKIKAVALENKRKIYTFVYYSGHGVTLMINGQQMTCMVHTRFSNSIKSLMKMMPNAEEQAQLDMFIEHFITNLQGLIQSLSAIKNNHVTAILNCCRVNLQREMPNKMGSGLDLPGKLTICYAVELGGEAEQYPQTGSTYSNAIWKEIEEKARAGLSVSFPNVLQYAKVHTSTIRGQDKTAKFESRWSEEDTIIVIPSDRPHPGLQALETETTKIDVLLEFTITNEKKKIPKVAVEYEDNDPSTGNFLLKPIIEIAIDKGNQLEGQKISYYSVTDEEYYIIGTQDSLNGKEIVPIEDLGTGPKLRLHLKIEPPAEEKKQPEQEIERLRKQLEQQDLGQKETKQSEQTAQIALKQPKKPTLSLKNENPWGFEEKEENYKHQETVESCKDKFSDEESLIITSFSVNQNEYYIKSMKINYKSGKESTQFGYSGCKPDKEIPLPGKPISKIDFHKGKHHFGGQYEKYLGGLTIYFRDGTSQKVGPHTDTHFKSVEFNQGQYWVGLKTWDDAAMYYHVQVLTLN